MTVHQKRNAVRKAEMPDIGNPDVGLQAGDKPARGIVKTKKTQFAPLPVKAIGDSRLAAIHFRALAAVAYHDRLSGPKGAGQGCWASLRTLARMMGVHYTNASTALTELVRWGHLEIRQHPMSRRTKVYQVIYDETDIHIAVVGQDSLPVGKLCATDGVVDSLPVGEQPVSTVCPPVDEQIESQGNDHAEYIPHKREEILQKQEIDSVKTAPIPGIGVGIPRRLRSNTGGSLAQIERELRSGSALDANTGQWLQDTIDDTEYGDPNHHRAERILADWGDGIDRE